MDFSATARRALEEARAGMSTWSITDLLAGFRGALDLSRQVGDVSVEFEAWALLGHCLTQEHLVDGLAMMRSARRFYEDCIRRSPGKWQSSLLPEEVDFWIGTVLDDLDRPAEAVAFLEGQIAVSRGSKRFFLFLGLAQVYIGLRRFVDAENLVEEMPYQIERARVLDNNTLEALLVKGELFLAWGKPERAVGSLQLVWDVAGALGQSVYMSRAAVLRSKLYMDKTWPDRDLREARRYVRRALEAAWSHGRYGDVVNGLVARARVALAMDDAAGALRWSVEAAELVEKFGFLPGVRREDVFWTCNLASIASKSLRALEWAERARIARLEREKDIVITTSRKRSVVS